MRTRFYRRRGESTLRKSSVSAVRVLVVPILAGVLTNTVAAQPAPARTPPGVGSRSAPLDPLTPEERRLAEQVTRADSRVKELLGSGQTKLILIDFFAIKPDDPARTREAERRPIQIGRHAEVLFYRYEDDSGVRAVVDLERRAVREAERVSAERVPMSAEELEEAKALAARSEELRAKLGRALTEYRIGGMRYTPSDEKDSCARHRCMYLLFRRGDVWVTDPIVIVDLTSRTVRLERGAQQP